MFTYNGIDTSELISVTEITGRGPMSQETERISIPGRPGSLFVKRRKPERPIGVKFELVGNSLLDIRDKVDQLNEILDVEVPSTMVFDDQPSMTFYGILDGQPDWTEILFVGKGTLNFICPDPDKYGPTKQNAFSSELATILNAGTAETYPTFTATVKAPITYLDIVTDESYMRIGQPVSIEDTIVEPNEVILDDGMGSLVGWTTGASIDGGVVAGTLKTNGNEFYVDDFGTGTSWHGPTVKKSLSQTLQDFMVEIVVSMSSNTRSQVGRIELYLLDVNGAVIGKVSMKDVLQGDIRNETEIRIGELASGKYILTGTPANYKDWSSFFGILRLVRVDNTFTAYVSKIDDNGNHVSWIESSPIQVDMLNELAAVQVHIGAQSTISPVTMKIHKLKVFKKNKVSGSVIPYIADIDDVITIDHKTNNILINGESRLDLKDFGAPYFPLKKGQNIISYSPSDDVDLQINWQERYL